tara:strand:+ start:1322 stop:2143 length:822 start_codon:yes stop_codon:yes gene_type:complete
MSWNIKQTDKLTFDIRGNYNKNDDMWVLLTSDHHWDNPKCDRKLLKRHLDEAKDIGAAIIFNGDTFCAMGGKGDPRRSNDAIRQEHWGDDYLNRLIDTASEWYAPYADNIALIGMGNHEESILKNYGMNLVDELCNNLGAEKGDYEGFVRFKRDAKGLPLWMYFNHGFGGGGATKGISAFQKVILKNPADIYWMGHIHEQYAGNEMVRQISERGKISLKKQSYVRTSTYKQNDPYLIRKAGSGIRPLGSYWLKISSDKSVGNGVKYIMQETDL